jgi:uroporphyrinogen-III decarboxylase
MDLGRVARRLVSRFLVAGNVSTTILTLGSPEDVRREVRRCARDAAPAGGHFLHAGGDLPQNIPVDNMKAYFEAARELHR